MLLAQRSLVALLACPRSAPVRMADFAALDWDAYHVENAEEEWLLPYQGVLQERLREKLCGLPPSAPLLELGCGTSSLAAKLYDDGWRDVKALDISRHCVQVARKRHGGKQRPGLQFAVGDARKLATVPDAHIGAVLDKGTLDAICCGEGFDYEAKRVSREVNRVLAPGGRWLVLSLMPPSVLMPLLQADAEWSVLTHERVREYHLYRAHRSRKGSMLTRWHWHPVPGHSWRSRVRCPL